MKEFITTYLPEIVYICCGLVSVNCAFRALKNEKAKYTTFLFWFILGIIFIAGKFIPSLVTGILLCVMGLLTFTKQVQMGKFEEISKEFREKSAKKLGNIIFIPALLIGTVALIVSFIKIDGKPLPSAVVIGAGCFASLIAAVMITRPKVMDTREDTSKLLMQVGASALLPQLLGALGTVFTKAEVGNVISQGVLGVVPHDNIVLGVIAYCFGMVIFTMIMGNAFAAFSVITVGVGIPFVIAKGANPAVVAALGMTCGYCGTLLTPMAANFNIVPSAVLETKNKWSIIKTQAPIALVMIVIHIVLMLLLAF